MFKLTSRKVEFLSINMADYRLFFEGNHVPSKNKTTIDRFGKNVIITDIRDWSTDEIVTRPALIAGRLRMAFANQKMMIWWR